MFLNFTYWFSDIPAVSRNGQASYRSMQRPVEDPLEILKRRFAEGSISEEEFIRMKSELYS